MMRKAEPLIAALAAAADTRRRVNELRTRNAAVPFPVMRAFIDRLQENFTEAGALFALAARGVDIQALADAELIEPPADVVATFGSIQAAGQAVVAAYVTEVLPAYGVPVTFDPVTALHVDAVIPWGSVAPMLAPLAALDAALAELG